MVRHGSRTIPSQDDVLDKTIDIQSKRDLLTLAEVLDSETYEVMRTTFVYLDKNEDPWFGLVARKRKQDVTVEDIKNALRRVPNTNFRQAYASLMIAREEGLLDYYVKRPKFLLLDDEEEADLLPQIFPDEVQILEFLKQHPHPNIVRYYGCRVKHGRVTGILLEKHESSVHYSREKNTRFEVDRYLKGLRAGVEHLHSLGLAHNDLNPSNILIDKENNPIINDFGSCRKFGQRLVSAGTPGWMDEDYENSERRNDEAAIRRIEAWLNDQRESSHLMLWYHNASTQPPQTRLIRKNGGSWLYKLVDDSGRPRKLVRKVAVTQFRSKVAPDVNGARALAVVQEQVMDVPLHTHASAIDNMSRFVIGPRLTSPIEAPTPPLRLHRLSNLL
ncbi:hypothetical protein AC579_3997 [Pseudocercospora musae]|uniref:Protein kinase domain-containing protein n=1 Tax=Pseudocercospora musae TaxID=113226 RepID=A0A139II20_9PEZI|nr:hypothetical protein AC579_3997 [Pseudocercospora musae]